MRGGGGGGGLPTARALATTRAPGQVARDPWVDDLRLLSLVPRDGSTARLPVS